VNELWDKVDPGFFEPVWLLVGLLAVVAVVLLEIGAHRRRQQALRTFVAAHLMSELTANVSSVRRIWKRLLLVGAVACLFIALARPHLFFRWDEETRSGIDLLVAVDCSKSMLTEDVKPNRLERAKLAISDLADELPGDRLGLIAFAGDSFLQVPLTLDHDAFETAVQELDTDTIPRPGTDVGGAIDAAVNALKSQAANTKILVLVTDGEDLEGRAVAAAQNAAKAGLKIYCIGVGTSEGDLIPERDDSGALMYLHDSDGQIVKSRLDESTLGQIASITGGAYARLGQRGEGLQEIYDKDIATLPRHQVESRRHRIEFEQYEWPLSLAILLLVASMLISERTRPPAQEEVPLSPPRRRALPSAPVQRVPAGAGAAGTALAILLALGLPARASVSDAAERDYKAGKYPQAEENYQNAAASAPKRDDLKFNLGDAAYKAGEYSQAEDAFRQALETPDLGLQEKAYYNIGNAQYRQGEATEKYDQKKTIKTWEDALKSYESALKLHPSADTQYNYEYVKRKLEQLKQQQQQQDQQQKNQDQKSQQQKNSGGIPNNQGGSGQDQNQANQGQAQNPNQQNGQGQQQNGQNPQPSPQQAQNGQQPDNGQGQGQPQSPSAAANRPMNGHSVSRAEDQVDPGQKSQQEAEALLDSLKDDEKHITPQSFNDGNQPPPPPPSGKDW
jgi:Ca-activated chloride channel family protein